MFPQDTSIQCQGSIYMHNAMFSCSAITPIFLGSGLHQKAVPLVWSQGLQPQRDGASCLGFLITQQRQCWQRLLGFPSLNMTFSSACLLQTLLKDNTVCGCLSVCRQNVPPVLPSLHLNTTAVRWSPHKDEMYSNGQERTSDCCILSSGSHLFAWILSCEIELWGELRARG